MVVELKCEEVWREISNYVDGELAADLRRRMEAHFNVCPNCAAVMNGARNVVQLAGDGKLYEPAVNFGQRLFKKLDAHLNASTASDGEPDAPEAIPLGITDDAVPLGSHLLYFWQNDEEFARGVRFLEAGLNADEHCVLQGHDEVNHKGLQVLAARGFDTARLISDNRLTVLGRRPPAEMMTNMAAVFDSARRMGARAIRYLGNLGLSGEPIPGTSEAEICNLEARTTSYISRFPCVLVCMYDVRSLPGRMIVNCGLRNHPQTIGSGGVQENPHYIPAEQALPGLRHIH
ncbi:MAG: MEDS domain-containing protein [Acidobacteriaceae bacterium]|nr:MEDS domain-containing protein [Acidobacteriaceae bacterium]